MAAVASDQPALIDRDRIISWGELARRVDGATRSLVADQVRPGERIAVFVDDPISTITALLAVLRAGAIAALIPTGLRAPEVAIGLDVLGRPRAIDVEFPPAGVASRAPDPIGRRASNPPASVVVLTSGTTARPKGVVLPEASLAASADAWLSVLPAATGWLLSIGLGHVAGLGVVWRAIRAGVPIRVAPAGDPEAQLLALRSSPPVSHVSLVPAQLARLLEAADRDSAPPGLRAVLLGGGPIPPKLVVRAVDRGWPVFSTYGLSEAGSGVTCLPPDEARRSPGSAGRALPGITVQIDQPDPDGIGEIVVTTPAGFSGYLGEPPRPPLAPIATGDLGRIDEAGRLHVADRRLDRIVRGGENISPLEVEAVLEAHPAIAEAAVVGGQDPTWGQVPLAAIVLRPGAADPGDAALEGHARASLAGFKVPTAWLRLDALPRTATGKLQRDAVRRLFDGSGAGMAVSPVGLRAHPSSAPVARPRR
jgi:O-succinylbenzoic acid--CoA ligase